MKVNNKPYVPPPPRRPTTIREWLETLPPGYRERAINNLRAGRGTVKKGSLPSAITAAFHWEGTREGHNFWSALCTFYGEDNRHRPTSLPPLPNN